MNTVEVLEAARDLISQPERWTQGVYARSATDVPSDVESMEACKFCSVGAVLRVCGLASRDAMSPGQRALVALGGVTHILRFNDKHTHSEVLDAFNKAIGRAKAEP